MVNVQCTIAYWISDSGLQFASWLFKKSDKCCCWSWPSSESRLWCSRLCTSIYRVLYPRSYRILLPGRLCLVMSVNIFKSKFPTPKPQYIAWHYDNGERWYWRRRQSRYLFPSCLPTYHHYPFWLHSWSYGRWIVTVFLVSTITLVGWSCPLSNNHRHHHH